MLMVNGSESFQRQVRTALEHLDPSAEVINRRVYFDSSIGIASHQRGHELLRRLVQSGYDVTIVQGDRSLCDATYKNGQQTGSTVIWRPGEEPSNAPACFCIALGHELGHADQFIHGLVGPADLYPARRASSGLSPRIEWLNITGRYSHETWDGITENQLRHEHVPRLRLRPSP